MTSRKRILITGGAGFIGSHLSRRLLGEGNQVICVDNLCTGQKGNIIPLLKDHNFRFLFHDVTTPFAETGVLDEIYNLACPASPIHYQRDPVATTRTSVLGALTLLDLAAKTGAKLLQASTSEVYGNPEVHPQPESYWGRVNPVGVRSCYDEGKRCTESLFFDYHRTLGVRIKIARIFNTYGPLMNTDDGRVVSNFIVQALQNKPLTVYGRGEQTRSFCYVDDLVEGLILLMNSSDEFTGPVNLGNPKEFSILELVQKVLQLTGSKADIVFRALPLDDPLLRCPDITLAKEKLGWSPRIPLEEGLCKTIDYFRTILGSDQ